MRERLGFCRLNSQSQGSGAELSLALGSRQALFGPRANSVLIDNPRLTLALSPFYFDPLGAFEPPSTLSLIPLFLRTLGCTMCYAMCTLG